MREHRNLWLSWSHLIDQHSSLMQCVVAIGSQNRASEYACFMIVYKRPRQLSEETDSKESE